MWYLSPLPLDDTVDLCHLWVSPSLPEYTLSTLYIPLPTNDAPMRHGLALLRQ